MSLELVIRGIRCPFGMAVERRGMRKQCVHARGIVTWANSPSQSFDAPSGDHWATPLGDVMPLVRRLGAIATVVMTLMPAHLQELRARMALLTGG